MTSLTMCHSLFSMLQTNVDHNIRTLDGNDTFHGMGMIAAITSGVTKANTILRAKPKLNDVAAMGKEPVIFHRDESIPW